MNLGLTGKRALVTGSTAGIGLATARALAREGAVVTINGRTQGRVEAAALLRREVPGAAIGGIFVIDSSNPKVAGMDDGAPSFVRFLYQMAR